MRREQREREFTEFYAGLGGGTAPDGVRRGPRLARRRGPDPAGVRQAVRRVAAGPRGDPDGLCAADRGQRVPLAPAPSSTGDPDRRAARATRAPTPDDGARPRQPPWPPSPPGSAPSSRCASSTTCRSPRSAGCSASPTAPSRARPARPRDAAPAATRTCTWRRSDDPATTSRPCSATTSTATEPSRRPRRRWSRSGSAAAGSAPAGSSAAWRPPRSVVAVGAAVAVASRFERRPADPSRGIDPSSQRALDDYDAQQMPRHHGRARPQVLERSVPDLGPVDVHGGDGPAATLARPARTTRPHRCTVTLRLDRALRGQQTSSVGARREADAERVLRRRTRRGSYYLRAPSTSCRRAVVTCCSPTRHVGEARQLTRAGPHVRMVVRRPTSCRVNPTTVLRAHGEGDQVRTRC